MNKPNRSFGKKVFAAGLAISTALWATSGLFVFVAQAVEAHPAGTLVLSGGTVWHISDDGTMRHGIDSLEKFNSQRYSFANVVPANSADLALSDGGLLHWGSGALFNDGGTVYQVSGGTKHGFTSAANFTGNGFSFGNVVAGSLAGVTAGAVIDSTTAAHLEGTFVVSGGTVWMITATGRKGVPSPGVLYSYGADFGDAVAANAADLALAAEGNATFRTGALVNDSGTVFAVTSTTKRGFPTGSCFTGFGFTFSMPVSGSASGLTAGANYCADTTPPTSAGSLSVALASDTPAAGVVVENAARVGFTKVNFTAGASDVVIDSLTVERVGLIDNDDFADIILLDVSGGVAVGQAAQIGNEKSFSSNNKATFNDDVTVKAGQSKSLMLAANMDATLEAGESAAFQLTSVTLSGTATLSGSLPVKGNTMTMNATTAIGTLTVAAGGSEPAASTQKVGTNDYIVSSVRMTAGSQEDIEIQQIRFYQNGTAADSDVATLELLDQNNAVLATVAKPTSKEVVFKLSPAVVIKKGENNTFSLRLDITDGSSRTISFDFEKRTDVVGLGKTFGYYRLPTYPNSTTPYYNAPNTTIDVGSLTFSKGVAASLNVARGGNSQILGVFKATVTGEPVQVTRLAFDLVITGGDAGNDITNIVVKDKNGSVVAGPFDGADNTGQDGATTTDTIIFPAGTNDYTVVGNLNTDFANGDTILVRVSDPDGQVTAKGTVTNQTVTANPTADLSLDTMTVKGGQLLVSTQLSPAAQTIVIGKQDFVFANVTLDASTSGEDVRVTQLAVRHTTSANNIQDNIANLEVVVDGVALSPIIQPSDNAATSATSTFSFTSPIVVTKGSSKVAQIRGDVNAGSANDTHAFGCAGDTCATVTGASTGTSITPSVTFSTGQTMTLATTGTLTVAGDASTPNAGVFVGGATAQTVQVLTVTAAREDMDLTEIHFEPTAVNGGALNDEFSKVYLFDGSTQIASVVPTTTTAVTFQNIASGLFRVTSGTSKKLTVKVDAAPTSDPSNPASATGDSGDGIVFVVNQDAYAATGLASGSTISADNKSGTHTANQFTVYKTAPTIAQVSLPSGTLVNTSGVVLYRFKVTADAKGDLGLYAFNFAISTTTATVTQFQVFEEPGTTNEVNLTNNATRTAGPSPDLIASSDGKGGQYRIRILFDTGTDGVGNGGEFRQISAGASKTFELRGTVANSASGSTVSTLMMGDNAFTSTYPMCAGLATGGDNTCSGIGDQEQGKFIWSDLAFASASSTATNTIEWFNGFRMPGLTTTSSSQVLSR